jgi:eukaryotic-like serine/threonine-protein kinase
MTPDLRSRLRAALGDACRLERDLGGGGMSGLFLATGISLNREVVIKLLPPEFTSEASAARFRQETEVTADA